MSASIHLPIVDGQSRIKAVLDTNTKHWWSLINSDSRQDFLALRGLESLSHALIDLIYSLSGLFQLIYRFLGKLLQLSLVIAQLLIFNLSDACGLLLIDLFDPRCQLFISGLLSLEDALN